MAEVKIKILATDEASGALGKVKSALGSIGTIAAGILTADLLRNIGEGVASIGREAFAAVADYERLGLALESLQARELLASGAAETMADALKLAAPAAEELLGWVEQLAIQSPFSAEDVSSALKTAMAYGFTTDEAKRLTEAMLNFAAGTGATGATMDRVALALGQIRAKGKLAGGEILQLTEAGFAVNDILKEMGFTLDDVSKGLVSSDAFLEAFTATIERDFGDAGERAANTLDGLTNSILDLKSIGLRNLFRGIFEPFKEPLSNLVAFLNTPETMQKLKAFGETIGTQISGALRVFGGAIDYVRNIVAGTNIGGFISGIENPALRNALYAVRDALVSAWEAFQTHLPEMRAAFDSVVKTISGIAEKYAPVILENFGGAIEAIAGLWSKYGDEIIFVFKAAAETVMFVVSTLLTGLSGIFTAGLQLLNGDISGALETIKGTFGTIFDAILGIAGTTRDEFVAIWRNNAEMFIKIGKFIVNQIKQGLINAWETVKQWLLGKLAELANLAGIKFAPELPQAPNLPAPPAPGAATQGGARYSAGNTMNQSASGFEQASAAAGTIIVNIYAATLDENGARRGAAMGVQAALRARGAA